MKKLLIVSLLFILSLPCFAVPGYDEAMNKIGGQPRFYDVSDIEKYGAKLEKEFSEKHKGVFTGADYNREVMIPLLDYLAERQKQGFPGYAPF